jgi:2-dehydro-3-deoxygluconokinase
MEKNSEGMPLKYDVVTLGETMIRLSPPGKQRIEQAESLELRIGGAESNVAVDLARLGLRTAWVSRLVDNPLGRRIASEIRAHGVDTSHVIWTRDGRVGTYFVEFGAPPRPIRVWYDRADSAIALLSPEEIDWQILTQTRLIHLTGITVALSENCARVVKLLVDRAQEAGVTVSFDVNYRSKLWSTELAAAALRSICMKTDILFIGSSDAERLFGCEGAPEQVAVRLREIFGAQIIALTLADGGSICIDEKGVYSEDPYPAVVEVDRVGAGDAFASGFLFGHLEGKGPAECLPYARALAAIKYSIPGDLAITTREELESLVFTSHQEGIQR